MLTIAHIRAIILSGDIMNNKKDNYNQKNIFIKKEYEPGVYVTNAKMEKEIVNVRRVLRKLFESAMISVEGNYFDKHGVIVRAVIRDMCIKGESDKRLFERATKNAQYVEIITLNDSIGYRIYRYEDKKTGCVISN